MKLKNLLLKGAVFVFFAIVSYPFFSVYATHGCPEDLWTPPSTLAPDGTPDYTQCLGNIPPDCPTCFYPQAKSSKIRGGKCKGRNKFLAGEEVYVKGELFWLATPSVQIDVDIYVTQNRRWVFGDSIASAPGTTMVTVTTEEYTILAPDNCKDPVDADTEPDIIPDPCSTQRGRVPCTLIWGSAVAGSYDIVIDANQDGIFNTGDAVDGKGEKAGFKVTD